MNRDAAGKAPHLSAFFELIDGDDPLVSQQEGRRWPSSVKTFVLSYRVDGIKHLLKLGRYGPPTLPEARDRAEAARLAGHRSARGAEAQEARSPGEAPSVFARPLPIEWPAVCLGILWPP